MLAIYSGRTYLDVLVQSKVLIGVVLAFEVRDFLADSKRTHVAIAITLEKEGSLQEWRRWPPVANPRSHKHGHEIRQKTAR